MAFRGRRVAVEIGNIGLDVEQWRPVEDVPLARVSERVQLFSRLLTRSLLYKKLNCIHRNPVIEMIVEKEEDDHFSSVRNYADPDSLIEITRESKLLITY